MSIGSIFPIAASSLRKNMGIIAYASGKIVQMPVNIVGTFAESNVAAVTQVATQSSSTGTLFDSQAFIENHDAFSDQDLLTQVMRIKKAEIAYRASGILIRTADEMSDEILKVIS